METQRMDDAAATVALSTGKKRIPVSPQALVAQSKVDVDSSDRKLVVHVGFQRFDATAEDHALGAKQKSLMVRGRC